MHKRENKLGISLIVLVITILVMIILAGVVVVSLQKNNPIEKAKTAKDTSNLSALKEELELYKTNELMQGNKDANNISFTETEVKDILKNIPENLKGKVVVSNGKLGVGYSKITEEARDYARENDIFNAEDKTAPDADIYVETINGKKYVTVDGVDYISDIATITCKNNGKVKVSSNPEKIVVNVDETYRKGAAVHVTEELKKFFGNATKVELLTADNVKDANVIVNYGSAWNGIKEGTDAERVMVERLNKASKDNPCVIITSGNDTFSTHSDNPLFVANFDERTFSISRQKVADNCITRILESIPQDVLVNDKDTRMAVQFKESPYITNYYLNNAVAGKVADTGMYLNKENGKAWMHMHTCGQYYNAENVRKVSGAFVAAITKATGSRSMSVDVTSAVPGTIYTFIVKDFAGNEKEVSLTI